MAEEKRRIKLEKDSRRRRISWLRSVGARRTAALVHEARTRAYLCAIECYAVTVLVLSSLRIMSTERSRCVARCNRTKRKEKKNPLENEMLFASTHYVTLFCLFFSFILLLSFLHRETASDGYSFGGSAQRTGDGLHERLIFNRKSLM